MSLEEKKYFGKLEYQDSTVPAFILDQNDLETDDNDQNINDIQDFYLLHEVIPVVENLQNYCRKYNLPFFNTGMDIPNFLSFLDSLN